MKLYVNAEQYTIGIISNMAKISGKIIFAEPRGFCAGVRRALQTVETALKIFGAPVYVRHEIVHNGYVVENLKKRGVIFVENLRDVPQGAPLIFSAHGVSPEVENEANFLGLNVIDATCPLVKKIHHKAIKYHSDGYVIILIGHEEHPEIIGIKGQIKDKIYVVDSVGDIEKLPNFHDKRIRILTQTTLSSDETDQIIEVLRRKYGKIDSKEGKDICYATQNRQAAIKLLAEKSDVIFVIGSKASSNAVRLKEAAVKSGVRAYLINSYKDIKDEMLKNAGTLGITAGASTPETLVETLVDHLEGKGWIFAGKVGKAERKVTFTLPQRIS